MKEKEIKEKRIKKSETDKKQKNDICIKNTLTFGDVTVVYNNLS